jgi:putative ubiquitin-RnfH superfamily antitoxin RatB of RatAB toxin-antitoxin module
MANAKEITVEVVYALPEQVYLIPLKIKVATTIRQAIELSGLLQRCPEIDLNQNKVGIFGRLKEMDTLLQAGDRVEIYRHLKVDPKDARRMRAEKKNKRT